MSVKRYFKENKKVNSANVLLGISFGIMLTAAYAFFTDFTDAINEIKTATVQVQHSMSIDGVSVSSASFYFEPGEIYDVQLAIENRSGVKVRTESYLQITLPEGTENDFYVYDASYSDAEIEADIALGAPSAEVPEVISSEGKPDVLQYKIPGSNVAVDNLATEPIYVDAKIALGSDAVGGVSGNINSVVMALQHDFTADADFANVIVPVTYAPINTDVEPTGITLNKTSVTLTAAMQGETLVPTIEPANATDRTVTWTSSNPAVATVDQNGIVIAYSAGSTTITATTSNGLTATCNVTVSI